MIQTIIRLLFRSNLRDNSDHIREKFNDNGDNSILILRGASKKAFESFGSKGFCHLFFNKIKNGFRPFNNGCVFFDKVTINHSK